MQKAKKEETKTLQELIKETPKYMPKIIPTNLRVIDVALCGGLELGSVVQIVGESGIGKSTILLNLAGQLCCYGNNVLFIDTEGSISNELLEKTSLNYFINDKFIYIRENTFKNVEKTLDAFINTNEIQFVIVDSLAGLIHDGFMQIDSKKSISITSDNTGYNSKKLVNFMNKYNALAKSKNICFIVTNQHRNQIDMKQGTILKIYGSKNVIYNSDVILRIKSPKTDDDFKKMTASFCLFPGVSLQLEIVKSNKRQPTIFPFYFLYGSGVSNIISDIYALIQMGYIKMEGNGYYKTPKVKVHGITDLYIYYKEHLLKDENINNKLIDYYDELYKKSATPIN